MIAVRHQMSAISRQLPARRWLPAVVLILAPLFALLTPRPASATDVRFLLSDWSGVAATNVITLTPVSQPSIESGRWVLGLPITLTPSNGTATASNLSAGTYRVAFAGVTRGGSILVPDGTNLVDSLAIVTSPLNSPAALSAAYSASASDARYASQQWVTNFVGTNLPAPSQTNWPAAAITNAPWIESGADAQVSSLTIGASGTITWGGGDDSFSFNSPVSASSFSGPISASYVWGALTNDTTGTAARASAGWPTSWPASSVTNQLQPAQIGGTLTNDITGTAARASAGWPTNWPFSAITNANHLTNWSAVATNTLQALPVSATFLLPPTIYAASGYEFNLWTDGAAYLPRQGARVKFSGYLSDPNGAAFEGRFRLSNPGSSAWTTNTLSLDAMEGWQSVSKTVSLIVAPTNAGAGTTRKLLILGDSTISGNTLCSELLRLFSTNGMSLSLVGTAGGNIRSLASLRSPISMSTALAMTNPAAGVYVFTCTNSVTDYHQVVWDVAGVVSPSQAYITAWAWTTVTNTGVYFRPYNGAAYVGVRTAQITSTPTRMVFAMPFVTNNVTVSLTSCDSAGTAGAATWSVGSYIVLSNLTISIISNTNVHHEAFGGWTYADFASGVKSPFVTNGTLNFSHYARQTGVGLTNGDWVITHLGLNGIGVAAGTSSVASACSTEWIAASNLFASVHALNPNIRCAMITPWAGAASQDAWGKDYGIASWGRDTFLLARSHWCEMVCTNSATIGAAAVLPVGAMVDSEWGFPMTAYQHSQRVTNLVYRYSNGVHPNDTGYAQAADGYFHFLKANQ